MRFERVRWIRVVASICFLLPISACKPCRLEIDGHCYDKPDKNLPGLKASWQVLNAETLKPIPDAFVRIGWREFPANAKSFCVLNELGRTDENGRLTTQGKNGSWMIESATVSALDFNGFKHHNTGFEKLTRKVRVPIDDHDTFRAWRQRFLEAGYQNHQNIHEMERSFAVDAQDLVNLNPFHPNGLTVYMTDDPEMQYEVGLDAGFGCLNKSEEPEVAAKGDSKQNVERFGSLLLGYKSYLALCDDIWDSVSKESDHLSMIKLASMATFLVSDSLDVRSDFMARYELRFDDNASNYYPAFSKEIRHSYCKDLSSAATNARSALAKMGRGEKQ
jgi:hypothetical protein